MKTVTLTISVAALNGLRALRLWHWRELLRHRARLAALDARIDVGVTPQRRRRINAEGNYHLKQVQFLNDLFPEPGDTAERDASR
jgi:hypothetical protein